MKLVKPKTPTSYRTLALPRACVEALRCQRHLQDLERRDAGGQWANDQDLVFTTTIGTPLDPSNARRALKVIADRAGLGHIHPHLLRHAAASLLSDAGVSLEDIADTLGHRSVTVTANVYRHPLAPVRTGHMAAMSAFGNAQPEPLADTVTEGGEPGQACKTLAHELAHIELGHGNEDCADPRSRREVEAESVVAVRIASTGLTELLGIAGWYGHPDSRRRREVRMGRQNHRPPKTIRR